MRKPPLHHTSRSLLRERTFPRLGCLILLLSVHMLSVGPLTDARQILNHRLRGLSDVRTHSYDDEYHPDELKAMQERLNELEGMDMAERKKFCFQSGRPCEWCHGREDNSYVDTSAGHACGSFFFRCESQHLRSLHTCAAGESFDETRHKCVEMSENSACLKLFGESSVTSTRRIIADSSSNPSGDFVSSPPYSHIAMRQINALLAFKHSVVDDILEPGNGALANWKVPQISKLRSAVFPSVAGAGSPECAWFGITCDAEGFVTALNLTGAAIASIPNVPSLPPDLGNLTRLETLLLAKLNSYFLPIVLSGPIPKELFQITTLSQVDLSMNNFFGSIPEFGDLQSLFKLSLASNSLTGGVPRSVGRLVNLNSLDLSHNFLTSEIPQEISGCSYLGELTLGTNNFTGPIPNAIRELSLLSSLTLSKNQLTGEIPAFLGDITTLTYIDLGDNNLVGEVPETFAKLKQLSTLNLNSNRLSMSFNKLQRLLRAACELGASDPNLGVGMLTNLDLSYNDMYGSFTQDLSACAILSEITIEANRIGGELPGSLFSSLTNLNALNVGQNYLSGAIPSELSALTTFSQFTAGSNNLTGAIPSFNCQKQNAFVFLWLFNNSLEGPIPDSLFRTCKHVMTEVRLGNNRLNGSIAGFSGFTVLQVLSLGGNDFEGPLPVPTPTLTIERGGITTYDVSGNKLNGTVPDALWSLSTLSYLNISDNLLSGGISSNLGNLGSALVRLNLADNQFFGPLPDVFTRLSSLQYLNLSGNQFTGPIPGSLTQFPNLFSLDLSGNQLSGPLPNQLGAMKTLRALLLDHNQFSGQIPLEMAPPQLPNLQVFNVSGNSLSGYIPYGFANVRTNESVDFSRNKFSGGIPPGNLTLLPDVVFSGNPNLCGGHGYATCPKPSGKDSLSTGALLGIIAGAVVIAVAIAAAAWYLSVDRNEWSGGTMMVFKKLSFSLTVKYILEVTENFDDKYLLGRGGFGSVYKATLMDGQVVAIKRLAAQSGQGDREVQAEIETLGRIAHRNLVSLVAAFVARPPSTERLLIYNFVSGGSLDNILDKEMPKDSPYRTWEIRRSIALDVARAMKYLHHDSTPRIVHRDMKPANVLMDENLVAYVADFGLAREMDPSKGHKSTALFGTVGYLAPEYIIRGHMSFKSDVYAYGVLLLQLITGKQPTDADVAEKGLSRWVGMSEMASIADPQIVNAKGFEDEVVGAIKLGLLCTARLPADRPTMEEVTHLLENLEAFAKGISEVGDGTQN